MAAGTPRSAVNASIRIGNAVLYGAKWDVNESPEELDTSNFEGGGYSDRIVGMKDVSVDVEGYLDGGQNQFDSPISAAPTPESHGALTLLTVSSPGRSTDELLTVPWLDGAHQVGGSGRRHKRRIFIRLEMPALW